MDSLPSQSVSIDGLSVRKIREEKRLTQLYVAKVVGVTTDTVSRWENNRYPTIRRDNALNLAEALEVDIEDILKKEPELDLLEEENVSVQQNPWLKKILLICAFCFFLIVTYILTRPPLPAVPLLSARRIIPVFAAPGSNILIKVEINSEKKLKGMILKERFPVGWQLIESIPVASSVDGQASGARWIFRNPEQHVTLYYMVRVAEGIDSHVDSHIVGEVIANPDGQHSSVIIENGVSMSIKPLHWADTNGNAIIDDLEILEVSNMTEETGQLNLEWDLIESIWEAGRYQWHSEKQQFVPMINMEE
jgi:transcriptional regulator with XRE-family HTH domain